METTTRRIRNYKAMNDDKLVRVYRELYNEGDAYWRCIETGSGDPSRDAHVVGTELMRRGLVVADGRGGFVVSTEHGDPR